MEIVFGIACVAFVLLIGYHCMKESDSQRRFKEKQAERVREIQAERARQAAAAYDRQRAPRSAPVTTGRPKNDTSVSGFQRGSAEVKRHDNSFENVVDTYTTPTYSSSHKSSGSCSGGGSSSSSDSSSSSGDSGGGGCD